MKALNTIRIQITRSLLSFLCLLLTSFTSLDEKSILFASFKGKSYSDNPRALFEEMLQEAEFADFNFIWAFKNIDEAPEIITSQSRCKVVRFNSFSYYYQLAKAKYWVFNSKMAPYYHKKKEQVYLQTWHGTPLKHLAHDIENTGITYYRSQRSYQQMEKSYDDDSKHWDYLISADDFASKVFTDCFQVSAKEIISTGYPRVDELVNHDNKTKEALRRQFHLPLDKRIILYAPTWRDDNYGLQGYVVQQVSDFEKWYQVLGDNTVILFKPHYLIAKSLVIPEDLKDFVTLFPINGEINDAYLLSDALITDYSSVFFDYAVLQRPIYFYMHDLEKYEGVLRGFYLDVTKDLPNSICRTEDELLQTLTHGTFDFDRLKAFNARFNPWSDGRSSQKVIEAVFQ